MVPADRRAMCVQSEGIQILVLAPECLYSQKGNAIDGRSALARVMGWVRDLNVPDFRPLGPPVPTHPKEAGSQAGHYSSEGKILLDPEEFPIEVVVPEGDEDEGEVFSDGE